MSAAAGGGMGGSDDDGGGNKIPPPRPEKLSVARKPIAKKRPLVPFTYLGKMSCEDVMRSTLERQCSRRERGWATAAPPPTPSQDSSLADNDGKNRKNKEDDNEANSNK